MENIYLNWKNKNKKKAKQKQKQSKAKKTHSFHISSSKQANGSESTQNNHC